MIDEMFAEFVRRVRERYGGRVSMPFDHRPVFVVDGFRFYMFKQEKAGAVSMWFGDGPIVKGTAGAFDYGTLLEQLDAAVRVEQAAKEVSETG